MPRDLFISSENKVEIQPRDLFVEIKPTSEIMTPETYAQQPREGEIMALKTFKRETKKRYWESGRGAKDIGQFVGGIAGAGLGVTVGHPYVGGAVGGTVGRTLAGLLYEQKKQIREITQKQKRGEQLTLEEKTLRYLAPPFSLPLVLKRMTIENRAKLGKETLITGAIETAVAPIGIGLNYAGRGMLKGLLGARVAERGFERGFKKILNPEYYKNRVPKMIAEKTNNFFNRLSRVTGEAIDNLLQSPKYQKVTVLTQDLKQDVMGLMGKGTQYKNIFAYIDDIIPETRPAIERNILKQETQKILSMGGTKRKISTLWTQRRNLDKLINSRSWGEEAVDYLTKLRRVLNRPIKSAGDDIALAFNKYHFVKEGEYDLGKKFAASLSPEGEIYASNVESFAAEIMSTKKDELIRRLKDLDKLTNASDKVIEDFLDYAASEAIEKKMGLGVFQETLVGLLGGRKSIAKIGMFGQTIPIKIGEKIIGRSVPIMGTNIFTEEE